MKLKDDTVCMRITEPRFLEFLFDVDNIYRAWGSELIITSAAELGAKHSRTSLHYIGHAVDIRVWRTANVPNSAKQTEVVRQAAIDYLASTGIPTTWIDVVLESDHIHIEWQPKYCSSDA